MILFFTPAITSAFAECRRELERLQENTCTRISFLMKVQASGLQLYLKKETVTQVLSCELCESFKNTFFYRAPLVAASVHWNNCIKSILVTFVKFLQICLQNLGIAPNCCCNLLCQSKSISKNTSTIFDCECLESNEDKNLEPQVYFQKPDSVSFYSCI